MKARIIISPTGRLGIFTDEGTLEQGAAKIAALLATLRAAGIAIDGGDRIEQHRHDDAHIHAHAHTHAEGATP